MGISIIVPVYNIPADYVTKCIESIKAQTYQDWEAIIVDDGSREECAKLLDSFQSEKVQVFHKPNGGLSSARNYGLEKATGEWIIFADSDDWLESDQFETLLRTAQEQNADCVSAEPRCIFSEQDTIVPAADSQMLVFEGESMIDGMLEVLSPGRYARLHRTSFRPCMCTVWSKLYRRELIEQNNVSFPLGMCPAEDVIFNLYYLRLCRKLVAIEKKLYNYRVGFGVTSRYLTTWIRNNVCAIEHYSRFVGEHMTGIECGQEVNHAVLLQVTTIFRQQLFHPQNRQTYREKVSTLEKLLSDYPEIRAAVQDLCNPYYAHRRLIAVLVRLRLYFALDVLYRVYHWKKREKLKRV